MQAAKVVQSSVHHHIDLNFLACLIYLNKCMQIEKTESDPDRYLGESPRSEVLCFALLSFGL